ncbi:hypothetical protein D3C75_1175110 [compost metagenome]
MVKSFAPSSLADSCNAYGRPSMKERMTNTLKAEIINGKMYTQNVPIKLRSRMRIYVGIRPPEKYIVRASETETNFLILKSGRLSV